MRYYRPSMRWLPYIFEEEFWVFLGCVLLCIIILGIFIWVTNLIYKGLKKHLNAKIAGILTATILISGTVLMYNNDYIQQAANIIKEAARGSKSSKAKPIAGESTISRPRSMSAIGKSWEAKINGATSLEDLSPKKMGSPNDLNHEEAVYIEELYRRKWNALEAPVKAKAEAEAKAKWDAKKREEEAARDKRIAESHAVFDALENNTPLPENTAEVIAREPAPYKKAIDSYNQKNPSNQLNYDGTPKNAPQPASEPVKSAPKAEFESKMLDSVPEGKGEGTTEKPATNSEVRDDLQNTGWNYQRNSGASLLVPNDPEVMERGSVLWNRINNISGTPEEVVTQLLAADRAIHRDINLSNPFGEPSIYLQKALDSKAAMEGLERVGGYPPRYLLNGEEIIPKLPVTPEVPPPKKSFFETLGFKSKLQDSVDANTAGIIDSYKQQIDNAQSTFELRDIERKYSQDISISQEAKSQLDNYAVIKDYAFDQELKEYPAKRNLEEKADTITEEQPAANTSTLNGASNPETLTPQDMLSSTPTESTVTNLPEAPPEVAKHVSYDKDWLSKWINNEKRRPKLKTEESPVAQHVGPDPIQQEYELIDRINKAQSETELQALQREAERNSGYDFLDDAVQEALDSRSRELKQITQNSSSGIDSQNAETLQEHVLSNVEQEGKPVASTDNTNVPGEQIDAEPQTTGAVPKELKEPSAPRNEVKPEAAEAEATLELTPSGLVAVKLYRNEPLTEHELKLIQDDPKYWEWNITDHNEHFPDNPLGPDGTPLEPPATKGVEAVTPETDAAFNPADEQAVKSVWDRFSWLPFKKRSPKPKAQVPTEDIPDHINLTEDIPAVKPELDTAPPPPKDTAVNSVEGGPDTSQTASTQTTSTPNAPSDAGTPKPKSKKQQAWKLIYDKVLAGYDLAVAPLKKQLAINKAKSRVQEAYSYWQAALHQTAEEPAHISEAVAKKYLDNTLDELQQLVPEKYDLGTAPQGAFSESNGTISIELPIADALSLKRMNSQDFAVTPVNGETARVTFTPKNNPSRVSDPKLPFTNATGETVVANPVDKSVIDVQYKRVQDLELQRDTMEAAGLKSGDPAYDSVNLNLAYEEEVLNNLKNNFTPERLEALTSKLENIISDGKLNKVIDPESKRLVYTLNDALEKELREVLPTQEAKQLLKDRGFTFYDRGEQIVGPEPNYFDPNGYSGGSTPLKNPSIVPSTITLGNVDNTKLTIPNDLSYLKKNPGKEQFYIPLSKTDPTINMGKFRQNFESMQQSNTASIPDITLKGNNLVFGNNPGNPYYKPIMDSGIGSNTLGYNAGQVARTVFTREHPHIANKREVRPLVKALGKLYAGDVAVESVIEALDGDDTRFGFEQFIPGSQYDDFKNIPYVQNGAKDMRDYFSGDESERANNSENSSEPSAVVVASGEPQSEDSNAPASISSSDDNKSDSSPDSNPTEDKPAVPDPSKDTQAVPSQPLSDYLSSVVPTSLNAKPYGHSLFGALAGGAIGAGIGGLNYLMTDENELSEEEKKKRSLARAMLSSAGIGAGIGGVVGGVSDFTRSS